MPVDEETPLLDVTKRPRIYKVSCLFGLIFAATCCGIVICLWRPEESTFEWKPCGDQLSCGQFSVPLDYANSSAGTASLFVTKYASALSATRRGTLFVNPGGPGASGSRFVATRGQQLSNMTGGVYDIVGWDPRGVNMSLPRATCFASAAEEAEWLSYAPLNVDLPSLLPGAPPMSTGQRYNKFYTAISSYFDRVMDLNLRCSKRDNVIWDYMDTASNARDIVRMSEAFDGKEAMIHYYGFSYGTSLGQHLINIFPEKVGHVILDGTGDPERWANMPNVEFNAGFVGNAEEALRGFARLCAEADDRCALAKGMTDPTAQDILDKIDNLIVNLQDRPMLIPFKVFNHYVWFTQHMFNTLYHPNGWVRDAEILQALVDGDPVPAFNASQGDFIGDPESPGSTLPYAEYGVECSDTQLYEYPGNITSSIESLARTTAQTLQDVSIHFGAVNMPICAVWRPSHRANLSYRGPWDRTLANKILILASSADPVSPLSAARKVQSFHPDQASLVIQQGYGHCTINQESACTISWIRRYFVDDTLPPNGSLCAVDHINPWL